MYCQKETVSFKQFLVFEKISFSLKDLSGPEQLKSERHGIGTAKTELPFKALAVNHGKQTIAARVGDQCNRNH
jgi:hypothetical protein